MKKRIIALMAIVSLAVSCQDAYNVDQPGYQFDDLEVFKTVEDIERGVSGIYTYIPAESEIDFVSYFTDELGLGRDNGGQGINDGSYRFFMDSGNSFANSFWSSNYALINRINRMLSTIDHLIETTPQEASTLRTHAKQLKLIRAYANLRLFAYYTPDYTNPTGLSIMKLDFLQTDDYTKYIPRVSVQEIVEFIESDVAEALFVSDESPSIQFSDNKYVSVNLAHGVLVKLYSMTRDYDKLKNSFENLGGPSIYIGEALSYSEIFSVTNSDPLVNGLDGNGDILFRLIRHPQQTEFQVASPWWSGRVSANPNLGSAYMEIGRSLYNALDQLDPQYTGSAADATRKDVRYNAVVLSESSPQSNYASLEPDLFYQRDLLFIGKYPGYTQRPLQNDIILVRNTDLYLCYLEALAHEGDLAGVATGLSRIREARTISFFGTPEVITVSSVQDAFSKILHERRLDFAFEGHRYLDMKRLGQRAGSPGFVRDPQDCVTNGACNLEANSFKMTLPIPRTEIFSNPLVAQQQNPGY